MKKSKAFTLAEALITIGIIGVIAAITIPSLLSGYEDKKYNTARLKALHTFGEAGKMASINNVMTGQTTAKDFVNNVLSKYLKIAKMCDTAKECNFPETFKASNSSSKITPDNVKSWNQIGAYNWSDVGTNVDLSTYITTVDGFSAKLFYNPDCLRDSQSTSIRSLNVACINVIYDMNGTQEPNQTGEDIGVVTTFWSGMKVTSVAPGIIEYSINNSGTKKATFADAPSVCASKSTGKNIYTMPNIDELSSLYINQNITSMPSYTHWSSSPVIDNQDKAWTVETSSFRTQYTITSSNNIWCIRR